MTFAGFTLSAEGNQVDHFNTNAIAEFPIPSNRTDLQSFFGLVNQLSSCTNAIASLLTPLRPLLSTKNDFLRSPDHQQTFKTIKNALTVAPVLSYFDINKPTRLCTDASEHGFITQQVHGTSFRMDHDSLLTLKPFMQLLNLKCLLYAGLSPNASFSFQDYKISVFTDQNPLVPIINDHRLDEIENPRLQRLKTKLMAYNFTPQWLKGASNNAPDALSRHPIWDPHPAASFLAGQPTTLPKEMFIITLSCPSFELLERRIVKTLKASVYKSYKNMLNKTRNTSNYAHSYWMDSLSSINNYLNPADDTGMSTSNYP